MIVVWRKTKVHSSIQHARQYPNVGRRAVGEGDWAFFYALAVLLLQCLAFLYSDEVYAEEAKVQDAAVDTTIHFNIPQQRADLALTLFAEQADLTVVFPYDGISDRTANALIGEYSLEAGIQRLLVGTGLRPSFSNQLVLNIAIETGEMSMNSKKQLLAATMAVFLGGGATTGLAAVDDDQLKDGRSLDEIIVTAQKREQRLIDVPISIATLGGEELASRSISDFEDLGLAVPGLDVQDTGRERRVFIRGIGNGIGSSSVVGIYLDEIPLSGGNPNYQLDLRTYDVERVEVLRGPQGTLYGQGSMGGTVRFITKDPQLDNLRIKADTTIEFTKRGASSQKIQGVLDIPIAQDQFGVRVSGTFEHAGGWIDQPDVNQHDINDENLSNIRVKSLWTPHDALKIKATAVVHRNDRGATTSGERGDGNYYQFFDQATTPASEDNYDIYNILINYDNSAINFLSSSSYIKSESFFTNFGNNCCNGFSLLFPVQDLGSEIYTQELRLSSAGDGPAHWTLGGIYQDAETDVFNSIWFGAIGAPLPNSLFLNRQNELSKSWALYANSSVQLTDYLELGAGIRYFEDDREKTAAFASTLAGAPTQDDSFDSVNPRLFANISLSDEFNIYLSAAEGFRSGGFNNPGQPAFQPEDVLTYELGSKFILFNGRLNGDIAYYQSKYDDYVIFGLVMVNGNPANLFSNAGDADLSGVDVSLNFQAAENLRLGLTGNYVDSEFKKIRAQNTNLTVGDPIDLVSRYQFTLSGTYEFVLDEYPGFATLDYSQKGRAFENSGGGAPSDVINLLNLNLSMDMNNNVTLGLFALNILNDRDFISPQSDLFIASRVRPRTVGFKVGFDFD